MRYSLFNHINNVINGKEFTAEENNVNKRGKDALNKAQLNGGTINIELGEFRTLGKGITSAEVAPLHYDKVNESLLYKCTYINPQYNVKYPVIKNVAEWKEVGVSATNSGKTIYKNLNGKRIIAMLEVSREYLSQNDREIEKHFIQAMQNEIDNAIIKAMLSDAEETADNPKGILNGKEITTIKSVDDLFSFALHVEQNTPNKCNYILSPSAKYKLCKLNNNLITNNSITDNEVITIGTAQNDYIVFGDLSKIVVGKMGSVIVTPDHVTKAKEGKVVLCVEVFANFTICDDDAIGVARVEI